MKRILVTDGDNRSALAVVRSLGRAGHWVAVGSPNRTALAQSSRYCACPIRYPDPVVHEEAFVDAVQRAVAEHDIDVVLPVTDVTTILLARQRERLGAGCRMPVPPAEVILRAADKVDMLATAMRLGVPVPQTVVVRTPADLPDDLPLPFPVVIKPHRSRVLTPAGWKSCTVSYAQDIQDLKSQLAARGAAEFPVALQERISGPGLGVFLCYDRGVAVGRFCHRRLREKPPTGGVSVLCESVAMSPDAQKYAERLLEALGWQGVAMVEFKVDERDRVPRLMEINGRFWGSLQLAIDAGVDFPSILMSTLDGGPPAAAPASRVGVQKRWLLGDIDSLFIQLFGKAAPSRRPSVAAKLRLLKDFLKFWGPDLFYENPKRDDLGPFLHEIKTWIGRG